MDNITIFDRLYPMDKQAEGMAVHWAVVSGACDSCSNRLPCENWTPDSPMVFPPPGAACATKKAEILRQLSGEGEHG